MDDLQPFFESRETRTNRLPAEARGRFLSATLSAREAGDTEFEDRQFVSLWIAQRTGLPRKQVLDNFKGISERFFGPGTTAAGAYDNIAATYKPAGGEGGEDPAQGGSAQPGAQAAQQDEEYAPVEGYPKPGAQVLLENIKNAGKAFMTGFEGFAQKTPAGLYSQAAAATAPMLKDPMSDPAYVSLRKQNETMMNPYQFTQVFDEPGSYYPGPSEADMERIGANSEELGKVVKRIDAENKATLEEWGKTNLGAVSQEYRRLAGFWYGLSKEAPERWNADPKFRASMFGQFMESAGSVPATVALAAMGPGGMVGLESAFFADVEGERMQAEGEAYDPVKSLPANLASALPQMAMERAFGVERLMNKVLAEVPKQAGRVTFGDFAKQFVRQGLTAGAEEGITEPAQGFWNDYLASMTYDQQRETLTGDGAKRRLLESVSGFALGVVFGGGVTTLEAIDRNRAVGKGMEYLTTKTGQVLTPADFSVFRQVKTDDQITATAPDPETGKVLLAAANGDKAAQADYNNRVLAAQFVKTEGMDVGGMSLGLIQGAPVVKLADGVIVPLDMTNAEDVAFIESFKKQAVLAKQQQETAKIRDQALQETASFLAGKVEEGREVKVSKEERTLRDFIQEGRLDAEDAAGRIGIANDVNAANLPAGVKPEDVRVLGANVAEYANGVYRDVSTIYAGGNALTAIEEVAEGYIKKRLAVGDVLEDEIGQWRAKYEAATKTKTDSAGTVSNIEWFSKRAVDYAVSNRKVDGVPASLSGFFRTLGEHLKTVFRLAQRMAKLKRDGQLEEGFEEALRAATGLGDQNTVSPARRKRQAELEQAFAPITGNGFFASSAANYERLKEQLQAETTAADEKATRERDFTRARLEEQLQAIADNQLAGDESITAETITPEQKWTLKAARRAREDGLKVRLSAQADRLLTEEGGLEDVLAETRANDAKTWRQRMEDPKAQPITPSEVAEAKQRREAAANVDPEMFGPEPTVATVDDDILDAATIEADFPKVAREGDEFVVTAPTGGEIGRASTQEAAMNKALDWYEKLYRGEEMAAVEKMTSKLDASIGRILTDVRQVGGLPAISTEKIFKGELRVIADGLPTHLRLKLFRKKGLQLDSLRESLNERGYNYDTVTDLLDDLDSAVRLLAEKNARGYMVTFSLAAGRVSPDQGDMFAGGETGGDTMFNLQGQEAQDFTGVVDKQAASAEAKKKAAKDQGELTFSLKDSKSLMAVHNISADKLRAAFELGGLPVPSLAIIRKGESKFDAYGDITLVAAPSLVDPKVNSASKVFNADIYSPRFPQGVRWTIDRKAMNQAWKKLAKQSEALGNVLSTELDESEVERKGLEAFEGSSAVKMAFLEEKGITPLIAYDLPEDGIPPEVAKFTGTRWEISENPEFRKAAAAYFETIVAKLPDSDIRDAYFDEDGKVLQGPLDRLARDVVKLREKPADRYGSERNFDKQIQEAGLEDEFKAWVKKEFSPTLSRRRLQDYNERTDTVRWLPYDLDSVVKVMKRGLRDGEGFNYGVPSIRSNVAMQFKSLKGMSLEAGQIISSEKMDALKKETNDEFSALADELRPYYRFESNRFGYLDEVSTSFKELATQGLRKWEENFKGTPPELLKKVQDFLTKLKTMPTEYFEAKIQRGVRLNEFTAAVIPSDTPADVRAMLAGAGLKVVEYPKGDSDARAAAVSKVGENPDITFATTGIPQNAVQALQAQAQRIRSKKLMATGELLARIQAGQSIPQRVRAVRRSTQASLLARLAVPVVSRLNALSPQLGTRLRRFEFDLGQRLSADYQRVLPFAQAVEAMKDGDAALLDLALKNGDTATRDAVLNTYGAQAQFAEVLKVIEETRLRAEAAGYEVTQIKDYFPRKVADLDGLMVHFHGRPEAGKIEKAIKEASDAALAQGRVLTAEERMDVTNSALQGNRKGSAMPGNLKTRSVDVVDVDANAYYTDSVTALSYYLETMNAAIEKRRFFGKYSVPVAAVPGANTSRLNLEASIGGIVEDLIAQDALDRQGQQEVQAILEARFNQQSSSEFIKNFKGLAYMSTMGQITSAMTQMSDLAFSLYENGVYDTVVAGAKAVTRDSTITKKSLGLETVAEEFRDTGAMHKAVDRVFKLVGIHYLDLIGKETLTNAKLRKMQREARAGRLSQRSADLINKVFGPQSGAQVIQDLAAGKVTPDVQFAVYNVLADYQPVSMSEYPEFYLRHPNGRVFYMLKTFTLKQIDAFRREALTQIVKGSAKQKAEGFRNLLHLAGLLYMIGVPVDWLKDWIMARDPQLPDIAVDNLFKLLGVNRWSLWRFRESKNPVEAAMLLVAPPAPFLVYPLTDLAESAEKVSEGDEIKPGEFESWRMLPFIGAPIYWYMGGGEAKIDKRRQKREKAEAGESRIKR